jgi:hypothetical protein
MKTLPHFRTAQWVLGCLVAASLMIAAVRPDEEDQSRKPARELVVDGKVVGREVEARRDEACLVCSKELGEGDAVYLVRGQRLPVHRVQCEAELTERFEPYLRRLLPRGSFLGASVGDEGQGLALGWFFLGLYGMAGLVFAGLSAHQAVHAGRNPWGWFAAALVLNVAAYLILLTRPRLEVSAPAGIPRGLRKVAATYEPRRCPGCGKSNHPAARKCAGCGAALEPRVASEVERAGAV